METFPGELKNYVLYQVGALYGFLREHRMRLQHVKPHEALYNLASKDEKTASEIISAVKAFDPELILVAPAGSVFAEMAVSEGLAVAREAFIDRAYLDDGQLAPRTMEGALIHDPDAVRKRVLSLALSGRLPTIGGGHIELEASTLCIHGDTPGAWRLAQTVRQALEEAGVEVSPMGGGKA